MIFDKDAYPQTIFGPIAHLLSQRYNARVISDWQFLAERSLNSLI